MNKGLFKTILLLTTIISCETKSQQTKISPESRTNEIVLINADPKDRCEMGQLIESLSECNPRVIGINFIFPGQKEIGCDSKFQQAIINSGKVVLIEGFEEGKHVESHKLFRDYALRSGTTGLAQGENDLTDSYYRVFDHRGRWEYSFPMHLSLRYDTTRASELAAKSFPKDYPIKFYSSTQCKLPIFRTTLN
ncbi:MAG: CHASE2 domain-containing protein [Cyclobacteriaceae bacterium]|nr:MAG: CHASE2 domain-containing protein [Cyclobacteriaceae bacterium]